MRLLFVTQALDLDDATLSAYHGWVLAVASTFNAVEVICLKEGRHALPGNVRVHSLGKEHGEKSRILYALRFLVLAWRLRGSYDAVFVHMNQEYLLIAGWLWKLLRKPAYLWRNHYAGSLLTDVAAAFCKKVFCTSKHSYTAKYKKTVFMPVGIDSIHFEKVDGVVRTPRSILFLARIAPSKRPELLIEALALLTERGVEFTATFYGTPLPKHEAYRDSLVTLVDAKGLSERVQFLPGVSNAEARAVFQSSDIFVNCSPSGMLDKTIFEAAAAGCMVLAVSDDFAGQAGEQFQFTDSESLAERLLELLALASEARIRASERLKSIARAESLPTLVDRLASELA